MIRMNIVTVKYHILYYDLNLKHPTIEVVDEDRHIMFFNVVMEK